MNKWHVQDLVLRLETVVFKGSVGTKTWTASQPLPHHALHHLPTSSHYFIAKMCQNDPTFVLHLCIILNHFESFSHCLTLALTPIQKSFLNREDPVWFVSHWWGTPWRDSLAMLSFHSQAAWLIRFLEAGKSQAFSKNPQLYPSSQVRNALTKQEIGKERQLWGVEPLQTCWFADVYLGSRAVRSEPILDLHLCK